MQVQTKHGLKGLSKRFVKAPYHANLMTNSTPLRQVAARLVGELRAAHLALESHKSDDEATVHENSVKSHSVKPIRLIHHFACTGGTLICRCIASMPNVRLLSEVDPLNAQAHANPDRFAPTDLVRLARLGTIPASDDTLQSIFKRGLEELLEHSNRAGLRLVLRDHAHGNFCFRAYQSARPTLRELLQEEFATRSVVTVRHPLASFMALRRHGWLHFEPPTIDEYAARYMAFLDRHEDVPRLQYEAFVASPSAQSAELCHLLEIPFRPSFQETLGAHRLSGDSGRSGTTIAPRSARPVPSEILDEARSSRTLRGLCERLGYPEIDKAYPGSVGSED